MVAWIKYLFKLRRNDTMVSLQSQDDLIINMWRNYLKEMTYKELCNKIEFIKGMIDTKKGLNELK